MPFPAAHRSRPAILPALLALVALLVAGCSGSSSGSGGHGAAGGSGAPAYNGMTHGAHLPLPDGLPTPAGQQASYSVGTKYGGTWTFTHAKASDVGLYTASLGKKGWSCALTEPGKPAYGYTCSKGKQKSTLRVYYLPKLKAIAVNYAK